MRRPQEFARAKSAQSAAGVIAACAGALLLQACGTLSRKFVPAASAPIVAAELAPGTSLQLPKNLRTAADEATAPESAGPPAAQRSRSALALSGGGANGAYSAGVIVGWTTTGRRPVFDLVTGVSTGALAAPFAFLGPAWDDALRRVYTDGETRRLTNWKNLALLFSPSVFGSRSLRKVIKRNTSAEMLRQIADESRRGRRLLVATTNLDTELPVIWDLGAIAETGGDEALILFREVLRASASVPGAFPPVLIVGRTADGQSVQAMHVDGGVTVPFLGLPGALESRRAAVPRTLYVIVNGAMTSPYRVTPGRVRQVLLRASSARGAASMQAALAANADYGRRHGVAVYVTAIPEDWSPSAFQFSIDSMNALFDLGSRRASDGTIWTRIDAEGAAKGEE